MNIDRVIEALIRDGATLKDAQKLAPLALKVYKALASLTHRGRERTLTYLKDWATDPDTQTRKNP